MGEAVATLAADTPLLGSFTLTTLGVFVLSGMQVWLLTVGLTPEAPEPTLAAAAGIYCLSQAGGSLSALPFGIGPADAIVVGLLLRTGMPFDLGTTVALLLRASVTLPIALAAAAAVSLGRRTRTAATEGQDELLDPLALLRNAPRPPTTAAGERKVPAWP
jgi:uncharacterized membrane protein YbhN (UPF0104 family)